MNFFKKNNLVYLFLFFLISVMIVIFFSGNDLNFENNFFCSSSNELVSFKNKCDLEVYFCPKDYCSSFIIQEINSANKSIDLAIYSFTLDSVADALIEANNRGVRVRVIFDYLQSFNSHSVYEKLVFSGIPVLRKGEGSWGAMHNKFIVIDEKKVFTGSFNYSKNADERNNENLLLVINERIVDKYLGEFNFLWFN